MSVPAKAGIQACSRASGNPGHIASYVLDCRFRGKETLQPANLSVGRPLDGRG